MRHASHSPLAKKYSAWARDEGVGSSSSAVATSEAAQCLVHHDQLVVVAFPPQSLSTETDSRPYRRVRSCNNFRRKLVSSNFFISKMRCLSHLAFFALSTGASVGRRRISVRGGEALSWCEIVDIVKTGQLSRFSREKECQDAYEKFKSESLKQYESLADLVLCSVFGVDFVENESRKRVASQSADMLSPRRIWRLNDFPYRVPDGVLHYVVWCTHDDLLDEDGLREFVYRQLPEKSADVVCWVNPPGLKSVLAVPHAHVLAASPSTTRRTDTTPLFCYRRS